MATTEADYLRVRRNGKRYLLLKGPSHFHLVLVNSRLTEAVRKRLMRLNPCDDRQLSSLGIHFSTFKAETLRGIVIKGTQNDDAIEFWLGSDVREYRLDADYTEEVLSAFFSGYLIKKSIERPKPELPPDRIRKISRWVYGITICFSVIFSFSPAPYWLWSLLCCLCAFVPFVPILFFPGCFTLTDSDKMVDEIKRGSMLYAMFIPAIALSLRALTDFTFETNAALFSFLGIGTLFAIPLFALCLWRSKDLRVNGLVHAICVYLFIGALGMGLAFQSNYLLSFDKQTYTVPALETHVSSGLRVDTAYCTVRLPDGQTEVLSISGSEYGRIEAGDDVTVTHYNGAFGIPFFTLDVP